jgi:hypothetical protein
MKRTVLLAVLAATAVLAIAAAALTADRGTTPPEARQTVPAPIDGLEVVMRESAPPQVSLKITAGLPSGCAQPHSHQLTRAGNTITVSVLNSMPTGQPICTMIYGSYDLTVDLGSDFAPGATYTVQVNDKTTTFKT